VIAYTIDAGTPTAAGTPFTTTPGPLSVTFHPTLPIAYVANGGKSPFTISALTVSTTGLTPLQGSPFALPAGDTGCSSIAIR
jgi:hypothetical protein